MSTIPRPGTRAGTVACMPPLRAAALCDLGLVAGPLCASLSNGFLLQMGSRPLLCAVREMPPRGAGGDPGRGRGGGPGRDETQASPGRGGRQGGDGQVAEAARVQPRRALSARRTCKSAAGDAQGGKFASGWTGGAAPPAVTLGGGHPPASPRVPAPDCSLGHRAPRTPSWRALHGPQRPGGASARKRRSAQRLTLGEGGQAHGQNLLC